MGRGSRPGGTAGPGLAEVRDRRCPPLSVARSCSRRSAVAGRLRPAGARHAPRSRAAARGQRPRRRHHPAQSVRPQPALRLRRRVRLRGQPPIAERRAAALSSTRTCPPSSSAAPSSASSSTRRCSPRSRPSSVARAERRARDAEAVADLLRLVGPLCHGERSGPGRSTAPTSGLARCSLDRRAALVRMTGGEQVLDDDRGCFGRLRDGARRAGAPRRPRRFTGQPARGPDRRPRSPLATVPAAPSPPPRWPPGWASARPSRASPATAGPRGRVLDGEFRPSGRAASGATPEVLASCVAVPACSAGDRARHHDTVARFLPALAERARGTLRGVDGVVAATTSSPGARCRRACWSRGARRPGRDYGAVELDQLSRLR